MTGSVTPQSIAVFYCSDAASKMETYRQSFFSILMCFEAQEYFHLAKFSYSVEKHYLVLIWFSFAKSFQF